MAITLGINTGFVTTAPTTDPDGGNTVDIQDRTIVTKDASPSTAVVITEVGWYESSAGSAESNFEVGLYSADGDFGGAGTLLQSSRTNAKGTSGDKWHSVTVYWPISPSTNYWLAVQLDATSPTLTDYDSVSGGALDTVNSQTTLNNPLNGGAFNANIMNTTYAVWNATSTSTSTSTSSTSTSTTSTSSSTSTTSSSSSTSSTSSSSSTSTTSSSSSSSSSTSTTIQEYSNEKMQIYVDYESRPSINAFY